MERIAEKAILKKMKVIAAKIAAIPRCYEWDPLVEDYYREADVLWAEFRRLQHELEWCRGAKVPWGIRFEQFGKGFSLAY